jgi:hypothetical protein
VVRGLQEGHPSGARILKPCKISRKGAPSARRCAQTLAPESCQGFRGRLSEEWPGPSSGVCSFPLHEISCTKVPYGSQCLVSLKLCTPVLVTGEPN